MSNKKKKLSLTIDPVLLETLLAFCKEEKRSISNATEVAIEEFLKNHYEGSDKHVKKS